MINIKKYISELSDENFLLLKEKTKIVITFRNIDIDLASKDDYCEKVMDYIDAIKVIHNSKASSLTNSYVSTLSSLINSAEKKTRVELYLKKYKDLAKTIKSGDHSDSPIKDFTRLFLCLYTCQLKSEKELLNKNFSFSIEDIMFDEIVADLFDQRIQKLFTEDGKLKNKYSIQSFSALLLCIIYFSIIEKISTEDE